MRDSCVCVCRCMWQRKWVYLELQILSKLSRRVLSFLNALAVATGQSLKCPLGHIWAVKINPVAKWSGLLHSCLAEFEKRITQANVNWKSKSLSDKTQELCALILVYFVKSMFQIVVKDAGNLSKENIYHNIKKVNFFSLSPHNCKFKI